MTGGLSPDPHLHAVTFYDHDREVVAQVARFVADGLHQQGLAIVIATPEHRTSLVQALLASGLDPDDAPVAGRLVMLDARTTLDNFMTDAGPDPDRFTATVEQIVRDAGTDGAPVRVFGEMVGLLWADDDIEGAIALEAMWNGLLNRVDFVLLCAYSSLILETGGLTEIHAVCGQHSNVQPPPQYTALGVDQPGSSRVYLPVPEAVGSSRRFVIAELERLGVGHLGHDAAVIVSELATNAVLHARSPFRVSVDEAVGVVCISVQDVGEGFAAQRVGETGEHPLDGRGIAIIEALARRWGCDTLRDGKVVWAELAA